MKKDIVSAWNEAEELCTSFRDLTKRDLVKCLPSLEERAIAIRDLLGKHVSVKDVKNLGGN